MVFFDNCGCECRLARPSSLYIRPSLVLTPYAARQSPCQRGWLAASAQALLLQWAEALNVFQQAADWIGLESRKSLWGQFWSAHQRFFKYLCIAAKVHRLVELAQQELSRDKVSMDTSLGRDSRSGARMVSDTPSPHPCSVWSSGCSPQGRHAPERCWMRTKAVWTASCLQPSE